MSEIINIESQEELNRLGSDFIGEINIKFGDAENPAILHKDLPYANIYIGDNYHLTTMQSNVLGIYVSGNAYACIENSHNVRSFGNSILHVRNSTVTTSNNSHVNASDSTVFLFDESSAIITQTSRACARDNSMVSAYNHSSVLAKDHVTVDSFDSSTVYAYSYSIINAYDISNVIAYAYSKIIGHQHATIFIKDSHSVGYELYGNSRLIYNASSFQEYAKLNNVKIDGSRAFLYKAVCKINNEYVSIYKNNFVYKIGEFVVADGITDDPFIQSGHGIHLTCLQTALNFWDYNTQDIVILELSVDINDIVFPLNSSSVRVLTAKVEREVPLDECGVCGKLIKREIERRK